ncbi:hypothetical protein E0W68_10025 [Flavobacterium salilacus subsp. salilacus]|uniref:KAP family P-loop NTPase fold protein n=1 Tax=Flavobacterium TaxID=237 RepID=UPI0010752B58|nr:MULTISPECIES: P-loop NTPase fold protein [Flavobacterium]KAF2518349.1 hypothetical protein E0W68_10025 [Flavobacterium salilacus subsp. salilacus]MBE1615236.1 hypothetical protein [Flavobacterium sp. SaA2.13]
MTKKEYLLNDSPISSIEEDIFNFSHYAEKVNTIIQKNTENPECIVIGIQGKWGDGKTSFMNLIKNKLAEFEDEEGNKRILKYEFNPWRYSTEDEMLFDFFDGLSKKLLLDKKDNFKKAGRYIRKFSRYMKAIKLSASIGAMSNNAKITFEPHRILEALGEDLEGEKPTLEDIKEKIDSELEKSDYKIAVYVDDIDRLDKDEIYTLLKIIKLNANFKNLIYIITLDPEQVAKAIHHRYGTDKQDGKLFLEKIINIPIVLPKIEKEDLQLFFEMKFKHTTSLLNFLDKEDEYKDILHNYNNLSFKSPREVLRLLNSFFISAFAIGEEVNLRDLFLLEYLKITDEECYNEIKKYDYQSSVILSSFIQIIDFNDEFESSEPIKGYRKILDEKHKSSMKIIDLLFPSIDSMERGTLSENKDKVSSELRINSANHFEKYFSYHTERKISQAKVKSLFKFIKEDNEQESLEVLEQLIQKNPIHTFTFRLEDIISNTEKINERNKLLLFLAKHNIVIPTTGDNRIIENSRERIFNKIAKVLDRDSANDNAEIATKIGKQLDLKTLCRYVLHFDKDTPYNNELYAIIVQKLKEEKSDTPFYENPENRENGMIIYAWSFSDKEEFNSFIEESVSKENIMLLIRNFAPYWNNTHFGALSEDSYDNLKARLDVDFVYRKLLEFYPEYIPNSKGINSHPDSDIHYSSEEENALQFIYWYRKDKEEEEPKN